jgi:hypothetical protein
VINKAFFQTRNEGYLPVNSSEFSTFPHRFITSVTPIIPKAKKPKTNNNSITGALERKGLIQ